MKTIESSDIFSNENNSNTSDNLDQSSIDNS